MSTGKFILIEGTEGAGKSTLARKLVAHLCGVGVMARYTREPGDGFSEAREALMALDPNQEDLAERELELFMADRRKHYPMIRDWVAAGEAVICDRGPASTIAYQCYARGLPQIPVMRMNTEATGGLKAELTILLDGDPATLLARKAGAASDDYNRFDLEEITFHERVREGFLDQLTKEWITVDATQPEGIVFEEALDHIRTLLK